jgi:hypothetical protein
MATNFDLDRGFVQVGTTANSVTELERILSYWVNVSGQQTVGDINGFGGSPVLFVDLGDDMFVLNRDTKRSAVRTFLAAAARSGGADTLRWHVTANKGGRFNRVTYRQDEAPTPGWYAYLRPLATGPRDLRAHRTVSQR